MHNLRERVRKSMKRRSKCASTTKLLGCTPAECVRWIESQFIENMNWDNIHVDHMMPCASFDLSQPSQQKMCFHYTNLAPLLIEDNLTKSDRLVHNMKWSGTEWLIAKSGNSLYRPRRLAVNLP